MNPIAVYLLLSFGACIGFFAGVLLGGIKLADKKNDSFLSSIPPHLVPEPRSTTIQYLQDVKILDVKTWHNELSKTADMRGFKIKSTPSNLEVKNYGNSIAVWTTWEKK